MHDLVRRSGNISVHVISGDQLPGQTDPEEDDPRFGGGRSRRPAALSACRSRPADSAEPERTDAVSGAPNLKTAAAGKPCERHQVSGLKKLNVFYGRAPPCAHSLDALVFSRALARNSRCGRRILYKDYKAQRVAPHALSIRSYVVFIFLQQTWQFSFDPLGAVLRAHSARRPHVHSGSSRTCRPNDFVPHIIPRTQFAVRESWSEWQDLRLSL